MTQPEKDFLSWQERYLKEGLTEDIRTSGLQLISSLGANIINASDVFNVYHTEKMKIIRSMSENQEIWNERTGKVMSRDSIETIITTKMDAKIAERYRVAYTAMTNSRSLIAIIRDILGLSSSSTSLSE